MTKSIKGKTGVFVPLSFTKYEKICKSHVQGEDKQCYCEKTGDLCNKENCTHFGRKLKEEEEY